MLEFEGGSEKVQRLQGEIRDTMPVPVPVRFALWSDIDPGKI